METYPLDIEKIYYSRDMLTLPTEEGETTLSLGAWLNTDPIRIHKMIAKEKTLNVDPVEVFNPLISKLRRADPSYFKRVMGLRITIDFPGFGTDIEAKIPFDNDPIAFYKWWRKGKHEETVYLSPVNQFRLFQKVSLMEPKVMLKRDIDYVKTF